MIDISEIIKYQNASKWTDEKINDMSLQIGQCGWLAKKVKKDYNGQISFLNWFINLIKNTSKEEIMQMSILDFSWLNKAVRYCCKNELVSNKYMLKYRAYMKERKQ